METGLPGRRNGRCSGTLEPQLDNVRLSEEGGRIEASKVILEMPSTIGEIAAITASKAPSGEAILVSDG